MHPAYKVKGPPDSVRRSLLYARFGICTFVNDQGNRSQTLASLGLLLRSRVCTVPKRLMAFWNLLKYYIVAVKLLAAFQDKELAVPVFLPEHIGDLFSFFLRGILSADYDTDLMIGKIHPGCQHVCCISSVIIC